MAPPSLRHGVQRIPQKFQLVSAALGSKISSAVEVVNSKAQVALGLEHLRH